MSSAYRVTDLMAPDGAKGGAANEGPGGSSILSPFTPDHDTPLYRRLRSWSFVVVAAFCLAYGAAFALIGPFMLLPVVAPLPVMALFAIWALPEARTAPVKTLAALMFAFVACLVLWPNYLALALPGLPWITMLRITGFPLVFILLVCVSISRDARARIAAALRATPLVWKGLVAFVVLQTLSIGLSSHVFSSLDRWVVAQTTWTAIFFASVHVFLKPQRVERMATLIWALAIIICAIGILEWRHSQVPWAEHIPSFLQIESDSVKRILAGSRRAVNGVYRVQSTFSTPLGLGEYLALSMPFVLQFALGAYKWPTKVAALVSAPLLLFVALISGSRLGLIGCLLSFLFYVIAWSVMEWRKERPNPLAPLLIVSYPMLFVGAIASTFLVGHLRHVVWGDGSQQFSDEGRREQWRMGIPKILSHPWGHGIGTGADVLGYVTPQGDVTIDSYFLLVLLEYGVIGFIIYYGMLLIAVFYAVRATLKAPTRVREYAFLVPLAIAVVNFFIVKAVFSEQDNHPLVFMMLGMIVALVFRVGQEKAPPAQRPAVLARAPVIRKELRPGDRPRHSRAPSK